MGSLENGWATNKNTAQNKSKKIATYFILIILDKPNQYVKLIK
jgi:hypothetical protein